MIRRRPSYPDKKVDENARTTADSTLWLTIRHRWTNSKSTSYAYAKDAEHLILTYSHAIDLALCHALLVRGFARAGLIGSATKRARFRKRLAELGHGAGEIARIDCPIGEPAFGKHPQAIAISVAAAILARKGATTSAKEGAG